jgi:hypothetical protein
MWKKVDGNFLSTISSPGISKKIIPDLPGVRIFSLIL